jgi:hypothetical protein
LEQGRTGPVGGQRACNHGRKDGAKEEAQREQQLRAGKKKRDGEKSDGESDRERRGMRIFRHQDG